MMPQCVNTLTEILIEINIDRGQKSPGLRVKQQIAAGSVIKTNKNEFAPTRSARDFAKLIIWNMLISSAAPHSQMVPPRLEAGSQLQRCSTTQRNKRSAIEDEHRVP
jgi:hypothetical protein